MKGRSLAVAPALDHLVAAVIERAGVNEGVCKAGTAGEQGWLQNRKRNSARVVVEVVHRTARSWCTVVRHALKQH